MTLKTSLFAAGALIAAAIASAPQAEAGGLDLKITRAPSGIILADHRGYDRREAHRANRFVSPRQITRKLRRQGFVNIFGYDRRGPVYVATALNRNGHVYRLRVSAFDGDILSSRVIGRGRGSDSRGNGHRRGGRG